MGVEGTGGGGVGGGSERLAGRQRHPLTHTSGSHISRMNMKKKKPFFTMFRSGPLKIRTVCVYIYAYVDIDIELTVKNDPCTVQALITFTVHLNIIML